MKTATEEEVYGVPNMTTDNRVEFLVLLSDAETEATIWGMAGTDRAVNQLERKIDGITWN